VLHGIAGAWVKLERAKEHIRHLELSIDGFLNARPPPYAVVAEEEPETRDKVYRVRGIKRFPLQWSAITGDCIHNIRSTLDILWRGIWYPDGGGVGDRKTQFSFFDSANEFEARYKRVEKSRLQTAVDIVRAFKPYKRGNELFGLLIEADDIDKHRGISLVAGASNYLVADFVPYVIGGPQITPEEIASLPGGPTRLPFMHETVCPIEEGTELHRVPFIIWSEKKVDVNPEFPIYIAFEESGPLNGKSVVALLTQFLDIVARLGDAFIKAGLLPSHWPPPKT